MLGTADGNVLLVNIHIASHESPTRVMFPSSAEIFGEDHLARTLFNMSSMMPAIYNNDIILMNGNSMQPPFRALGYNTPLTELIAMISIGSVSLSLMQ